MRTNEASIQGWWFETSRFENAPDVEHQVNPGRFGEGLAEWIAAELRHRGWDVLEVFGEDWGWVVRVERGGGKFFINCGNEDGSLARWFVGLEPEIGLIRRIFGKPMPDSGAAELDADIEHIISTDRSTTWHGREQPG